MVKSTVIVPCAGKSTRFPNLRPKYLLVNPTGNLMLIDAISKLNLNDCRLIVTILSEHEKKYGITDMLGKFFPKMGIEVCILDKETSSQSETVRRTIDKMDVKTPFLVKDADNIFKMDEVHSTHNYVTINKLDDFNLINATNKSYIVADSSGLIINIEEKKVVSNIFSVGGYYFIEPSEFVSAYEDVKKLALNTEIYISTIINHMIFTRKTKFKIKPVTGYVDLGTLNEWLLFKQKFRTYFIDIDGIIVKNGGEYLKPYWGTTEGINENIATINNLYDSGSQIILTTSRKEEYRKITEEQLKKYGVKYHQLIMGLFHSARVLINDFADTNPYPSAIAINIPRNSNDLNKFL